MQGIVAIMDENVEDGKMINSGYKPKRGQANRRERVRTENVNAGFDKLRKLIPTEPEDRKLSKIEILRLATSYIKHLYNLTRANSCLEANELDKQRAEHATSNEEDATSTEHETTSVQRRPRNHVCTFCLMITKQQQSHQNPPRQQVSTKSKAATNK